MLCGWIAGVTVPHGFCVASAGPGECTDRNAINECTNLMKFAGCGALRPSSSALVRVALPNANHRYECFVPQPPAAAFTSLAGVSASSVLCSPCRHQRRPDRALCPAPLERALRQLQGGGALPHIPKQLSHLRLHCPRAMHERQGIRLHLRVPCRRH